MKKAFTLLELLIVVAIMGLLGTAAVGGYRAMQRGMEERGVLQNANQFIRSAYQRAQIDRTPVAVFFWNETLQEETNTDPLIVVGKAVAVRRAGRLSDVQNSRLFDEFADLRFSAFNYSSSDEDNESMETGEGETDTSAGVYLYPMNGSSDGSSLKRSVVSQSTVFQAANEKLALGGQARIKRYAYYLMKPNGVNWKVGDAYGFEFAELQLPHGYIFGSSYSTSVNSPVSGEDVIRFKVGTNTGSGTTGGTDGTATIQICNLRPGSSGEISALPVGTTESPDTRLD